MFFLPKVNWASQNWTKKMSKKMSSTFFSVKGICKIDIC
uniref:Uncharacterized protein n=1 Tax=viral metagenome TaxID=1070528 RepID=A0A6C0BB87_9ZZZZ